MSVIVLLELTLAPEHQESAAIVVADMLKETRTWQGCESVQLCTDPTHPEALMIVEQWASQGHHEAYVAWRAERGDPEDLQRRFTQPPQVRYLEVRPD